MTDTQTDTETTLERESDPGKRAIDLVGHEEQLHGLAVYTGVRLGVFDHLTDEPTGPSDMATTLGLDAGHTYRLLRALESIGVLEADEARGFSLTPVGERFRSDHPESVREFVLFFYDPARLAAIRHLPDIVAEGTGTAYEREYDCGLFEYCERNPGFAQHFNGMQDLSSLGETEQILATLEPYDFGRFETICDVGGGYGDLLCHILAANPHLEGTVLELPSVLADEDRLWAPKLGVEDRCRYVEGDMFEAVPTADCYILKAILHDWPDDDCVRILSNVHRAAPDDGRLLVRERVVSAHDPSPAATTMDLWMLLETGGRERTRAEFETLFDRAGWDLDRVMGVEDELCILEAVKP